MYFDGSDVSLSSSSENLSGVAQDEDGKIYLVTTGNFSVSGRSGANEDVFVFTPTSTGSTTAGSFDSALFFDGSNFGLGSNSLTGIDLPSVEGGGALGTLAASAAVLELDGLSLAFSTEKPAEKAEALVARDEAFASPGDLRDYLLLIRPAWAADLSRVSVKVKPAADDATALDLAFESALADSGAGVSL
jgi:hypothetical protein